MGIRHGFGLFLQPMSLDLGCGRETFALAIAVQNFVWGTSQRFAGMVADKHGAGRIIGSALLCALGLAMKCLKAPAGAADASRAHAQRRST
jgi:sugar phosphate permease